MPINSDSLGMSIRQMSGREANRCWLLAAGQGLRLLNLTERSAGVSMGQDGGVGGTEDAPGKFKIVIMDAPCDENSHLYVKELQACGVTDVVRTCEPTYSPELFEKVGIKAQELMPQVHEMTFPDGAAPPQDAGGLAMAKGSRLSKQQEMLGAEAM
eukprot:Skav202178  [mRNA]  locus=scaffold3078:131787:138367:- [translate_table: standard]